MASLSQGRTAAAQCGLFTYKSVPVIFEPPCRLHENIPLSKVARAALGLTQSYIQKGALLRGKAGRARN